MEISELGIKGNWVSWYDGKMFLGTMQKTGFQNEFKSYGSLWDCAYGLL